MPHEPNLESLKQHRLPEVSSIWVVFESLSILLSVTVQALLPPLGGWGASISYFVRREVLLREIRAVGRGQSIRVQTVHQDAASEVATVAELRALYETHGYEVMASSQDTSYWLATKRTQRMALIFAILTAMAVMTAVVGAVALSGTLAINVLERTREIGVMRTIGASAWVVAGQFIGEGLILGWLSWLLAIPLSLPADRLLSQALARNLHIELVYQFSAWGIWYWLGIITVLAVIRQLVPSAKDRSDQRAREFGLHLKRGYVCEKLAG